MEREPNVVLASSRRLRIDEEGQPLPDILATCFPFAGDVLIDDRELVSFLPTTPSTSSANPVA